MTAITQVLLPNGKQVFIDANGDPLAGGTVAMYEPNTQVFRTTYQDPFGAVPNQNPVPLDAAGSAIIWGTGQYRQLVKSVAGTTLYDAVTYGLAPTSALGTGFGTQTNIVSATIVDLGTIVTHNALITGTANIESFGNNAALSAPIYYVEFDSTATLVYDVGSMILPGGQDLVMSHGDGVLVEYKGSSDWRVIAWFPAAGFGVNTQVPIASASLVDLGTVLTHNALITGTTDIESFGGIASLTRPIYLVEFDDELRIMNDDVSMILPGSKNINTEPGDCAVFEYLGGSNWRCRSYSPASGEAIVVVAPRQRTFVISANGAFTVTLPDTVVPNTRIKFTVIGPGGGGGSTDGGNNGGGQGGGAGGYWEGVLYGFHGGDDVTGSVGGNGGVGVAGAAGNDGNDPTIVTYNSIDFVTCGPGQGGQKNQGAGAGTGLGGAVTIDFTGLTLEALIELRSDNGVTGIYAGNDINCAGGGGSTPRGTGGCPRVSGNFGLVGADGTGYGAAGGGGCVGSRGGNGTGGVVIMEMLSQ